MAETEVPELDFRLAVEEVQLGNEKLNKLVQTIRPEWNLEKLDIQSMSFGFINTNFAVLEEDSTEGGLFVRIVSDLMPGTLERITNIMRYLRKHGIGARLMLLFKNGLVMELLRGEPVSWKTGVDKLRVKNVWLSIAREMARFHLATDWDDIKHFKICNSYDKINRDLNVVRDHIKNNRLDPEIFTKLPAPEKILELHHQVHQKLGECGADLRFCHNDTNPTNLIIGEDRQAILVDYDVCQTEYTCVDMCKLFLTLAGAVDFDLKKQATEEERDSFVREYLRYLHENDVTKGPVTERDVRYFHFLLRKARLLVQLCGVSISQMVMGLTDREFNSTIPTICWRLFQEEFQEAMEEKFQE